jgi:primosomal protein N'
MAEITSYESPPFDMLPSKIMSFYQSMVETANEYRKKMKLPPMNLLEVIEMHERNLEEAVRIAKRIEFVNPMYSCKETEDESGPYCF